MTGSSSIEISVVMPVYNAARNLRASLESVANQTYGNWQCICVDDGSTDASGEILDEYAQRDARFRVVHKENGGEGSARNAATEHVSGTLVTYLDSDDCLHPDALRIIAELFLKTRFDLLRFRLRNVVAHDVPPVVLPVQIPYEAVDYRNCGESPFVFCGLGCATAVTREIAKRVRWSDVKVGADLYFVMDCLMLARVTLRTELELVDYLINPTSVSHRIWKGLLTGTCEYLPVMLQKARDFGISRDMWAKSVRHVKELFYRKLTGSWRLLGDEREREEVRRAFWVALGSLVSQRDVYTGFERKAVMAALRRQSEVWLVILVVWPYRCARHLHLKRS